MEPEGECDGEGSGRGTVIRKRLAEAATTLTHNSPAVTAPMSG